MRARLDIDKIAKALGGERRGSVSAKGGYFGALNLVADVSARFKVPQNGGRRTDPSWTERRQLPLRPETLARLEALAAKIRKQGGDVHPMQLAALLLENATQNLSDDDVLGLVGPIDDGR
jgi:hypothetical protein